MERSRRRPRSEFERSLDDNYHPVLVTNDPLRPSRVSVKKRKRFEETEAQFKAFLILVLAMAIIILRDWIPFVCLNSLNGVALLWLLLNVMYLLLVVMYDMLHYIVYSCTFVQGFQDSCKHAYTQSQQFYIETTSFWHRFHITMIQGIKLCIQEALEDMKKVLKIPMGSLSKSKKDLSNYFRKMEQFNDHKITCQMDKRNYLVTSSSTQNNCGRIEVGETVVDL